MPYVNIKIAGALSDAQKKAIAKEVTGTLERVAKKPANYTYIVFEEVPQENWAIGGELLSSGEDSE